VQTETDQAETNDNTNAQTETTGPGRNRAYKEESLEEESSEGSQGTSGCQYLAKDRRRNNGEAEDWSIQGHLRLQP